MKETKEASDQSVRKRTRKTAVSQPAGEHGKVPPQATDLEEAVLGAMMIESNALTSIIDILRPEMFYKEHHQIIYKAILSLFNHSEPVDILTVTNELKKSGELDLVGGAYYITQLTNRIASAANIEFHSRIIIQKFIQRELIRISTEIQHEAFDDSVDVFDMLDNAERNLFSISETNIRRSTEDMHSLVREAVKQIEAATNQEGHISGVPSGFTELDRVTAGWQKSDLIIVAARPSMGKTAFVLSIAKNVAIDFKKPVAFFSLEMSAVQLVTRLISSETELDASKLKRGLLEKYEWTQLNEKIKGLIGAKLYIDDTPALSIFELRAKCRRLKAQYNVELIIIDYLQLMAGTGDKSGNREQEISTISRSLKALAKELSIPIIALSQLSRAVETRGGPKRPILSDLRESGAIEQDADLVLFLYRPEYYKIDDIDGRPTKGLAEVIIAKHRNGALSDIYLRFIDKYAKFVDFDTESYQDFNINAGNSDFDNNRPSVITRPSKMNEPDEVDPF
jgi:replicative DNA helicase